MDIADEYWWITYQNRIPRIKLLTRIYGIEPAELTVFIENMEMEKDK